MGGVFAFAHTASAQTIGEQYDNIREQGIIFAGICEVSSTTTCECRDSGNCTLAEGLQVLVNVSVFVLAISGSVLLLMFVYGGMSWLFSQGRPDWVEKGKKTLIGAVVGLAIIFGAYVAISVIISVLKTGEVAETGEGLEEIIGEGAEDVIETQ